MGSPAKEYGRQYLAYTFDPLGSLVQRQSQTNQAADVLDTVVYDAYGTLGADLDAGMAAPEAYRNRVLFGSDSMSYNGATFGLDAEDRLTSVGGPVLLSTTYDKDGPRVSHDAFALAR